jgi:hypothetical protein
MVYVRSQELQFFILILYQTKLHARSQVEVTDLSCRQGTTVDGEKKLLSTKEGSTIITYDKTILTGTEHTVRLVSNYPEFK